MTPDLWCASLVWLAWCACVVTLPLAAALLFLAARRPRSRLSEFSALLYGCGDAGHPKVLEYLDRNAGDADFRRQARRVVDGFEAYRKWGGE